MRKELVFTVSMISGIILTLSGHQNLAFTCWGIMLYLIIDFIRKPF